MKAIETLQYSIWTAKKLVKWKRILSTPYYFKLVGFSLLDKVEEAKQFYRTNEISRLMPGKVFVLMPTINVKLCAIKMLIFCNLQNA